MQIVQVNINALVQAAQLVVGVQAAHAIDVVYTALDAAERRGVADAGIEASDAYHAGRQVGYAQGFSDGNAPFVAKQEDIKDRCDDAFERGFLQGQTVAPLGYNAAAVAKETTEQPDDSAFFDIWTARMHRDGE